jgi:hypothetical protein
MIFGDLVKQKIPVVGILCGGSKLIEEKQNFVVCFTLRSLFSPHICSNDARLNSWCVRKPMLLLTAPFAVAPERIHRTKADGGLIAQHCFQSED